MTRIKSLLGFGPSQGGTWHVLDNSQTSTMCGRPIGQFGYDYTTRPARLVPTVQRCKAVGCRASWPADLRSVG